MAHTCALALALTLPLFYFFVVLLKIQQIFVCEPCYNGVTKKDSAKEITDEKKDNQN